MSLANDVLNALEQKARIAIVSLPSGVAGVERGWRPAHELQPGSTPHVFLFDVEERSERLIFQQRRISISLRGQIVRIGDTYLQALDDWTLFRAQILADADLGGVLEWSSIELEDVEDHQGQKGRAVTFSFSGATVLLT